MVDWPGSRAKPRALGPPMPFSRRTTLAMTLLAPTAARAASRDTWRNDASGRDVPVLLRWPEGDGPAPLVVISHGLGGSREGLAYLGRALAGAGIAALHVQHPGSDSAVWLGQANPFAAMAGAARDPRLAAARLRDVPFALDEALRRFPGRLDPARVAVAGHSFGAWTAAHVLGQALPLALPGIPDRRFRAGVLLSPVPGLLGPPRTEAIAAPLLHVTGTEDRTALDGAGPEERLSVFRRTAGVPQAAAVLRGAPHLAFAGTEEAGAGHVPPRFHPRIAALSVAFLRGALGGDWAAIRAPGLLESGDSLEFKDWPA